MTNFKGKNKMKSIARQAFERFQYNIKAFPENGGMGEAQIVNFNFAERTLYGRVDRKHNPVYAQQQYIIPIYESHNNESVIQALNFVANQFNDFQIHYTRACRMGYIPNDDPVLSFIKAHRGYEDPLERYRNYAENIMFSYVTEYLPPMQTQIKNFLDFIDHIVPFMGRMKSRFPLTFSGFQRSNQSSIFTSGLAIDIGSNDLGNDEDTQALILESPAFEFYKALAKQYGFSINKHHPSVLVSDLAGVATTQYRENLNLPTVDSVFAQQYNKTLYDDLSEFTDLLVDYYNEFVNKFPRLYSFVYCGDKIKPTVYERLYVDNINSINNIYNIILKIYIIIRNIEEVSPYTNQQLELFYNTAVGLGSVSEKTMLEYIDDKFREKYVFKKGTLTDVLKKNQKKLDNR